MFALRISQLEPVNSLHLRLQLTVRETLDFSARCYGSGAKAGEQLLPTIPCSLGPAFQFPGYHVCVTNLRDTGS